jgi:hypothetical protein
VGALGGGGQDDLGFGLGNGGLRGEGHEVLQDRVSRK